MSTDHQGEFTKKSMLERLCSLPRVQNVVHKSNQVMSNVKEKYNYGVTVSKDNAKDTLKEMGKFFSITEAKAAINYNMELAKDAQKELVGDKVMLVKNSIMTVFESQTRSMFNRNYFNIDSSADNESEDDE